MDLISASFKTLDTEKNELSEALAECDQMIKSSNNSNRKERKKEIMQIGDKMMKKFNVVQSELDKNKQKIAKMIDDNNEHKVNIDFNGCAKQKILKKINDFSIIFDQLHKVQVDEDDALLDKLRKNVKECKKEIGSLQQSLAAKKKNNKALKKELEMAKQSNSNLTRKLKKCEQTQLEMERSIKA